MANNEDLELDVAEKKGGSKKMLIIIIAVVVLGGGGAAAFFLMGGDSAPAAASAAAGGDAPAAGSGKAEAVYIPFNSPFNTNLPDGKKNRMVQVKVVLMSRNSSIDTDIKRMRPALTSTILNIISRQDVLTLKEQEGRTALKLAIKEGVNEAIDKRIGVDDAIEKVLFTSFVMQ
jgi:flagellar protein FliL